MPFCKPGLMTSTSHTTNITKLPDCGSLDMMRYMITDLSLFCLPVFLYDFLLFIFLFLCEGKCRNHENNKYFKK